MPSRLRPMVTSGFLIAAAICPLAAADVNVSDLRVSAGFLSHEFRGNGTTTITESGGSLSTSTTFEDDRNADSNMRGQIQYVAGSLGVGGGLIYGVGVAMNQASWDNGSEKAYVSTPTVDVLLGYGYGVTPNWHFELTPFAGYGRAYYTVTSDSSQETSRDWENYVEFGAKIATYVALDDHLVLGIEVPYLMGRFDPDYSYDDNTNRHIEVTDKRENRGYGFLASLGYRF